MNTRDIQQLLSALLVTPERSLTGQSFKNIGKSLVFNSLSHILLQLMAVLFNRRAKFNQYLKGSDGWINFKIGFQTDTESIRQTAVFFNGKISVIRKIAEDADVILRFSDEKALLEMLQVTPNEVLGLILKNRMILDGNLAYLQLFNYYVSLLMGNKHQKMLEKAHQSDISERKKRYDQFKPQLSQELITRHLYRMEAPNSDPAKDPGVICLKDPFLAEFGLNDFPRLEEFRDDYFNIKPEICAERAELLTQWFRKNGFEKDSTGKKWVPELRQAMAFKFLMENKKPIIRKNDLIAGTTTTNDTIGVIVYPDAQGVMVWGELGSIDKRVLNPYAISDKTAKKLHYDIFPFWAKRNFREFVRTNFDYPHCQRIEERWVAYFVWKSVGISHTIPDFKSLLEKGASGIIEDITRQLNIEDLSKEQVIALQSMRITLEGLYAYAHNLSKTATHQARSETSLKRQQELIRLANICSKVPMQPAATLDEAVNLLNIAWVALNLENANTGFSFGRLDQLLQPFFIMDMEKLETDKEKAAYIKTAIELIGSLFLRFSDHLPLSPDIGNYLFGGASSTQALTIGGMTPDGKDAVNDMTYIMLKAAEMLGLRDVNVNARFHPDVNSSTYLKRLCEVNIITAGTPSMHNDKAVFEALKQHDYPVEDMRDWSATGCVEPTISGKHMGHTGSILFNMVAPLEMALNNGSHPLMNWDPGPKTGSIENNNFKSFDDFFNAYAAQTKYLIRQAVEFNNMLAEAHVAYRPTPLLSAMMAGSIEKAADVTKGGAKYNTSGTSNIGLADVTDSMMVIKQLVFEEKSVLFTKLKSALDTNFENDPALHAMIMSKVPKFGSGSPETIDMANRIARMVHAIHHSQSNYRGGKYTTGFWSMSQHVAYGSLSGALPSGRLYGKAFTPGLTPHPSASKSFLDNIRDVAQLDPETMDNNIAFNVKLNLSPEDTREKSVDIMASYVQTYFDMGGMQLQFNVVTSETLKDAMANPENYKHLMVRISGYNAYFTMLNKEIQLELIERAEYAT
ncbi:MAG: formate acetyltransferase [Desulfobacteraceae bacterium]|nr:formate acetyltransferase [Desulfobacteraceae bacterium]MBC2757781.1 formate acetyltransferase [Desulfobacteraceae bacterium]MBC2763859.1 formate acetyltransferase [ANME-2 cluster archaeon]